MRINFSKSRNKRTFEALRSLCPHPCNNIQLNINERLPPHKHKQHGPSYILLLGSFTGGALKVEGESSFRDIGVLHQFDGTKMHHVEEFTGLRISIVFYTKQSYMHAFHGQTFSSNISLFPTDTHQRSV